MESHRRRKRDVFWTGSSVEKRPWCSVEAKVVVASLQVCLPEHVAADIEGHLHALHAMLLVKSYWSTVVSYRRTFFLLCVRVNEFGADPREEMKYGRRYRKSTPLRHLACCYTTLWHSLEQKSEKCHQKRFGIESTITAANEV